MLLTVFCYAHKFCCKFTQKIPYMQAYRDYFAIFLIFYYFPEDLFVILSILYTSETRCTPLYSLSHRNLRLRDT